MSVDKPKRRKRGWGVRVRWTDAAGERQFAIVLGETASDAKRLGQLRLAQERRRVELVKAGVVVPEAGPPLVAFIVEHVHEIWPATISDKHRDDQLARLEHHVAPVIGTVPVGRISRVDVKRCRTRVLRAGRSAATWNRTLSALSKVLTVAIEAEHRADNPCRGLKLTEAAERDEFLEPEEVAAVLAAAPTTRWRAFFGLAAYTGARPSSIRALRVGDVDLEGRRITFRRWKRQRGPVVMPAHEALVPLLEALLEERDADELVFVKRGAADPTDDASQLSETGYRKAWLGALQRAGIERPVRFYDLRASFATALLDAGVSPRVLRDILRHSSLVVTDRYVRRAERRHTAAHADAVARLDFGGDDAE